MKAPALSGLQVPPELDDLLNEILPSGWIDAAQRGDTATVLQLRAGINNPDVVAQLAHHGWIAPHWPVAHGGRGLATDEAAAVAIHLDSLDVPRIPRGAGLTLAAPTIIEWASDATKRRLLPPLASGEERWCQLFSEPGAGSDLASLAATAVRDGDTWFVNGQKVWTTMAHESELAMLLARTDPEATKHAGITYFAIDLRSPGVEVRPLVNMAGQTEFNEVFLTDVPIPDLYRISPLGGGWSAAQTTLGAERGALSGIKKKRKSSDEILGGKTWSDIADVARVRKRVDEMIIRNRLAHELGKDRVLGLTTRRAGDRRRAGIRSGPEASIGKVAKAASNQSLQLLAIDLLGASATAWESGGPEEAFVTQMMRTRANSIEGGTSEIQRNIIGERVLGLPREPDPYRGRAWNETPRS